MRWTESSAYVQLVQLHRSPLTQATQLANAQTAQSMSFDFMDYVINFIVSLDPKCVLFLSEPVRSSSHLLASVGPTAKSNLLWPQYLTNTEKSPEMMAFVDINTSLTGASLNKEIVTDDFRAEQMSFIQMLWAKYPL